MAIRSLTTCLTPSWGCGARPSGRSNQETAAALFMSVKTVEANLTRIYRKLSVRSRTELAHRVDKLDA